MTQEEKALRIHIEKLQLQLDQMKALSSVSGFYNAYFKQLKTATSNSEAFNVVNEQYYNLFGRYRYSSYDSFSKLKNKSLKKKQ